MGCRLISDRARVRTGWVLAVVAMLLVATIPFSYADGVLNRPGVIAESGASDLVEAVLIVAGFVFSGAWLIQRRPRNVIGWILLASGLMQGVQMSAEAYATRALTEPGESLPLALPAMWLASWLWMPSILLLVTVLPGLYPAGRPPSRFWVWQIRAGLAGIALIVLLTATEQDALDDVVAGLRLPWDTPAWWPWLVGVPAVCLVAASIGIALVGTLVRAVRATAPERQQLLWLIAVAGAMMLTVFLPWRAAFLVSFGLIPVAVVVGVVKYRLLGIEVALRRTLLYAPLTLMVALIVGASTTLFARLIPSGLIPLLIGSAVVALIVFPVAGRLRKLVDRLVLGEAADALAAVDRVGAGLETVTEDPVQSMLQAVARTVDAAYAAVRDPAGEEIAKIGESSTQAIELPLMHGGATIGTLAVGPRRREPRVTASDARVIGTLAPHLAVVVRSKRLTEELERERKRVTTATMRERDRLRRDMHDGLGPSLSGIALGLEAASNALASDPAAAMEILQHARDETHRAVAEVRQVIDGLRPAALDLRGLPGAIEDTAAALGLGRVGGTSFQLDVMPVHGLRREVEEAALRIVSESLNNIVKHAGANRCTVMVDQVDQCLRLAVQDDGAGILAEHTGGHGLGSIRRRAADLGGYVTIEPVQPHGTSVTAVLPLEKT